MNTCILGDLSDIAMYNVGSQLGKDWMDVGIQLGVPHSRLESLAYDHAKDIEAAAKSMLIRYVNG